MLPIEEGEKFQSAPRKMLMIQAFASFWLSSVPKGLYKWGRPSQGQKFQKENNKPKKEFA